MVANIGDRTVNALQWNFLRQFMLQGINFLILVILSRILDPNDFGLLAMVIVLTRLCQIFVDFGFGAALIHNDKLTKENISFVFLFNLLTSIVVAIGLVFAAPLIADFYDKPILHSITLFVAFNFVINASFIVQRSLLQKELQFKKLFFIEFISAFIAGVTAILFAVFGFGVWSLVAKLLATSTSLGIVFWLANPWMPTWNFSFAENKKLLAFSLPLTGNQTLNYFARNLDKVLVGKFWGDEQLGYYDKAYSLMLMPITNISNVVSSVMFPALATIQNDLKKTREIYLRTVAIVTFVTFPVSLWLICCSETVVLTILGEKWVGSIPIIRILAILGFTQSISRMNGAVFQSQGKTLLQFKWGLFVKLVVVSSIVLGVQYGTYETALAYMLGSISMFLPTLFVVGSTIKLGLPEILKKLAPTLGAALVVGGVLALFEFVFLKDVNSILTFVIEGIVGFATYLIAAKLFRLEPLQDLMRFVREKLDKLNSRNQPQTPQD